MAPPQVEDVYGLTPMQAGMLWATLDTPGYRRYHEQLVIELTGDLDAESMSRAWQAVVNHHPILRTGFHWEKIAAPVQVVNRRAELEVNVTTAAAATTLETLLIQDRERGFDLSAPPLMRIHLVEVAPREWRIVWSFSHLILDGWSLPLVLGDVMAAYADLRHGRDSRLTRRPPFRNFVAWLARRDRAAALAFWSDELRSVESPTPLGIDRAAVRPSAPKTASPLTEREWILEPELAAAVADLCQRARVTLGTVLYAAWALVLARYSGRDDVVFGTTASGRPADLPGAGEMVGIFITTVPVRVRVDRTAAVDAWLRSIQDSTAAATDAHHVPLPEIRAATEVPGDRPLFESLLVLENYPAADAGGEAELRLGEVRAIERTEYPLVLVASPSPSPAIKVAVDPERISAGAADRLLGHLRHALDSMSSAPGGLVGAIDVMGAEEEGLLHEWGRGREARASAPGRSDLAAAVTANAEAGPSVLAVTGADGELTYGELVARAAEARQKLIRGSCVGVCAERGPALAIGALATAAAGAVHVLLDPDWPDARVKEIADQTGITAVIASAAQTSRVQQLFAGSPVAVVPTLGAEAGCQAGTPQTGSPHPPAADGLSDLAYVVMTSGSTGEPKAVTATKAGLANLIDWHLETYGLAAGERTGLMAAPGFDASIWELWPALVAGATLCVPPPSLRADPDRLAEWMVDTGLHVAFVPTPVVDTVLAAHGRWPEGGPLRYVLTGGDALLHGVRSSDGPAVVNHYGPSESTVVSTAFVLRDGAPEPPPIGRPIRGTRVEIRDGLGRLSPIGVVGELWVSGTGLSAGYLGRADLTSERFVDGWYRTGDLCRWNENGDIQFVGREDDQVKVRGVRIELGEVEAALAGLPGVSQAVVAVRGGHLVGWVTGSGEAPPDGAEVRAALAERLPPALVPASIGVLDRLPLTANGKVDRAALGDPAQLEGARDGSRRPLSPTEELVAAIWREVLDVRSVSASDDFFALGGHSLSATRVASRLRSTFDLEVDVGVVFDYSTVRELARYIDSATRESLTAPIRARARPEAKGSGPPPISELPLSFAQQRLWFLDQLEPGAPTHNTGAALVLEGPLDVEALKAALDLVVQRHEALRTTFPERHGRPFQVVHDHVPVVIAYERGEHLSDEDVRQVAWNGVRAPFDLAVGPLIRVKVLALGPERHAVLLYEHHIVSDGWSMSVLIDELSEIYTSRLEGREPVLPSLPIQYADYAVWQREWLTGERLDRQLSWWREHLAGAPAVVDLPLDRPRTPLRSHDGASTRVHVGADVFRGLVELCTKRRATLFMGLMSALAALLGRVAETDDVVIGTPVANRNRGEVENLTGFFVNTLALRTRLDGDPTFTQLLDRVRATALDAYAHQDMPFEKLVEELAPSRDLRTSPLFQVMLDLADQSPAEWQLAGMTVRPLDASPELAPFDLTVEAAVDESGLQLGLNYATALFDEVTIRALGEAFANLLAEAVAQPDRPISECSLVDGRAREHLGALGAGPPLPERLVPVHDRIAEVAAANPDAVAIRWEGQSTTYAELLARVDELSLEITSTAEASRELIPVRLPKGPEVVATLLAMWNTGVSPLMLDPAWPEARVQHAIAEAEAASAAERSGLAYCICTSGSTGRPKVVAVTHENLAATAFAWDEAYRSLGAPRRFLSTVGVAFDVFFSDVVRSLSTGATLVLCPEETAIDPPRLAALIAAEGADHLNLVPSTARALASHLSSAGTSLDDVAVVLVGAEAWSGADLAALRAAVPNARLIGAYGVSEAAIDSLWFDTTGRDLHPHAVVPLGRPLAGVGVRALDAEGREVPRGVPGELWIAGRSVSPGYVGRQELTRQRFRDGAERAYRTGDRVRWSSTGDLEFLGRVDDQVQVRGQRVEPSEVEAVLAAHPDVVAAAVTLHNDGLVAFVVPGAAASPAPADLRVHVQAHLPLGMVPARYFVVDALPLGATGKVDRRALPALVDRQRAADRRETLAPRTGAEKEVAAIWAQILGVSQVGAEDNFFDLGGHSMLAAEVVAGVRERFGIEVPLRRLFESPTVADMAKLVEDHA